MKKIVLLAVLFLNCKFFLTAQTLVYNNEWINYSKVHFKFKIGKEGFYRINAPQLNTLGLGGTNCAEFVLFRDGKKIPIYTSLAAGTFATSDYIQFYAYENDGKNDTKLYRQPNYQLNDNLSLFADSATYFLTTSADLANNNHITQWANLAATSTQPPLDYYLAERRFNFKDRLNNGFNAIVGGERLYSSSFDLGEGYTTLDLSSSSAPLTKTFDNLHFNSAGPEAKLSYNAYGMNFWSRELQAKVNDITVDSSDFNSFTAIYKDITIADSLLISDNAVVRFKHFSTYPDDAQVISHVLLTYPSNFNFDNKDMVKIKLPAVTGNVYLEISNFNGGTSLPVLVDFFNNKQYEAVLIGGKYCYYLDPSVNERTIAITNLSAITALTNIKSLTFTNYALAANQGDYLIITNKILMAGPTNVPQEYANYRKTSAGGSFNAIVIDAEELVDQFAFGVKSHPLSIKNFIKYGYENFTNGLKYVLLAGKGMDYVSVKENATAPLLDKLNLVPTFGYPASDNMLSSATSATWLPTAPIGRLSVVTPLELKNYLEKLKQYELVLQDPSFSQAAKKWQKNMVQVVGNSEGPLQIVLDNYIGSYTQIAKDSLWGANVYNFTKTPDANGNVLNSLDLSKLFEDGINLFTYFGHSSATTLQFNLENPNNYNNQGKYPIFIVNGCNSGNFFTYFPNRFSTNETLSEKYVLTPNRGGIAFIASTHFGVVNYLDLLTTGITNAYSITSYNKNLGDVFKDGLKFTDPLGTSTDFFLRLHGEETGIHGDPAIKLYQQPLPDYSIEPQNLTMPNSIATIDIAVPIKLKMYNLGKYYKDSIQVAINRTYPNGTVAEIFVQKIKSINFEDSITFNLPIDPLTDKGVNKLTFKIDNLNEVVEMSETNNLFEKVFNISDTGVRPIYPYNYAIVNDVNYKLVASTINNLFNNYNYLIEIDTTALFNSPVKISTSSMAQGGIITYTPSFASINNTVYFWRVAPVPTVAGGNKAWSEFSYLYAPTSSDGFNQSHIFQQTKSNFTRLNIDSANRVMTYGTQNKSVQLTNAVYPNAGFDGLPYTATYDGSIAIEGGCTYNTLLVSLVNANTGKIVENQDIPGAGLSGSLPVCGPRIYNYTFPLGTLAQRNTALNFFKNYIPNDYYVMIRNVPNPNTADNTYPSTWLTDEAANGVGNSLFTHLKNVGLNLLVDSFNFPRAYSGMYKKGDPSFITVEDIAPNPNAKSTFTSYFPVKADLGTVQSPWFGPAKSWLEAHYNFGSQDVINSDTLMVELLGRDINGVVTVLKTFNSKILDTTINFVDANIYPYLSYKLVATDNVTFTPPILNYWRLNYVPVPEGAVTANLGYTFPDTVASNTTVNIVFPFKNISPTSFDSLAVTLVVYNKDNVRFEYILPKLKPLAFNDTVQIKYSFNTLGFEGLNRFYFTVNPNNAQPEQYAFNNLLYKYLYVRMGSLSVNCNTFSAQKNNGQVNLKWQNTIPSTTTKYIIEKSTNGLNYIVLSTLNAGNNATINNYNYLANLSTGANYFRLIQEAVDGRRVQLCSTLKIMGDGDNGILVNIFPNPVKNICNIQSQNFINQKISVTVTNNTGQVVLKENSTPNNNGLIKINMQSFASGTYFIAIWHNDIKYLQKIIKD